MACPSEGEAVIVVASITDIQAVKLPLDEQERAAQMRHQPSRARYLAGRYLLRNILSRWLLAPSHELRFSLSPKGKPYLNEHTSLHFSLSHCEEIIAVAFYSSPIGIDIEKEREVDRGELARRFFSQEEATMLEESQSLADFFQLWTCREAAIKGDGRGMAQLLPLLTVHLPKTTDVIPVTIEGTIWYVYHRVRGAFFHEAIALRQRPRVIHWCELGNSLV